MPNAKILHTIMDKIQLLKTIKRIASEILENDKGEHTLVILGLKTRGEFIAKRIYNEIKNSGVSDAEFGVLDATLFRDDFRSNLKVPNFSVSDMPFSVDGKKVVIVDDVIFTGRSVNAAINAIMDIGRPKLIRFAAIIDRGHRELPIAPDFIGEVIKTLPTQEIRVKLTEVDKEDAVYLVEKN